MMAEFKEDLKKLMKGYYIKGLTIKKVKKHPKASKIEDNVYIQMRQYMPQLEITDKIKDLIQSSNYFFPTIKNEDYMTWMAIFYAFLFLLDDFLDDHPKEYTKWMNYLRGKTHCPGNNDVERFLLLVRDSGKTLLGNNLCYKDMMKSCIEWLILSPEVQKYKDGPHLIDDDPLIVLRQIDGSVPTAFLLMELDSGLYPNKEFSQSEDWILFNRTVGAHFMIINDLFSFPKEVESDQGRFNAVFMKMKNNNMGVNEAMESLVSRAKETAETAHKIEAKLKALNNEKVSEYVDSGIACMYGNLYWSAICHRYHYGFPNFVDHKMLKD